MGCPNPSVGGRAQRSNFREILTRCLEDFESDEHHGLLSRIHNQLRELAS